MQKTDDQFYDRADSFIHLANSQITEEISRGKVSASLMYAVSRFNAWISACGLHDGSELRDRKEEAIDYFVTQYRKMLEENFDDYIENFNSYMRPDGK